MKYIVFILFTVMTNAAAQLMLKQGMMSLGPISFEGVNPLVKLLQKHGFQVGENAEMGDPPAPGVHVSGSWHYRCND